MHSALLDRFLRYVRINTQSDPESATYPSTEGQWELLHMLAGELTEMGASDVAIDRYGYVTATIPSTIPATVTARVPVIGFIAHVDTSPDLSGEGVAPRVVKYEDHTLITSDGTTLLGADDKAGVAEIMTATEYLLRHTEIPHGKIRIAFTPDEEIGRGTEHFDVARFGAQFAYTVDGGTEGSIEYETFNAAEAVITIHGLNTHPGYAKGIMVNSQLIATEIAGMLPREERPETTSGREGFYHLTNLCGNTEQTVMHYIVRDHDRPAFEARKERLAAIVAEVNSRHSKRSGASPLARSLAGPAHLELRDQYYNMREKIEPHFEMVEYAMQAMHEAGVEPFVEPVRGGTDGSRLSFEGLPCPNLFTGAENMHSRKEFVSLEVMQKSVETIVNICKLFYTKSLQNKLS